MGVVEKSKKKREKSLETKNLEKFHEENSNNEEPPLKKKKKSKKENGDISNVMVEKQNSEVIEAIKKKKKSKKENDGDLSNLMTEQQNSDIVEKKKKKKKDKKENVEDLSNVLERNQDTALIKTKKKYFRDKPEKADIVEGSESKSKFSISLPLSTEGSRVSDDLSSVLKTSGKGPKIIIAKDPELESKKLVNTKLSKRKRKKIASNSPEVDDSVHETKGMSKALKYLKTWSEDRESWKFEKCRQIWLLHNAYDELKVSDKLFPSLLCYIQSVKGAMRDKTLTTAQEKLEKSEKWEKLLSEDQTEAEIVKELGTKLSEAELKRSKQIVEGLTGT